MKKKGASLIWAIVMSMALIFIAVTVSSFIMKESQMTVRMDDSARAYAAAESGIEWGKYCLSQSTIICPSTSTFNLGTATYTVDIIGTTTIQSRGTSNNVNRKLETIINPNQALSPIDPSAGITVSGSFYQQFDYWQLKNPGQEVQIGVSDKTTLNHKIYFIDDGEGIVSLKAKKINTDSDSTILTSNTLSIPTLLQTPYGIRVRIEYKKDFTARMIVFKQDPAGGYFCDPTIMLLDLRDFGMDFGIAHSLYFGSKSAALVDPLTEIYSLGTPTDDVRFANMRGRGFSSRTIALNTSVPGGNGTITGNGASPYLENSLVQLTANADSGYKFTGWGGDSPCTTGTGGTTGSPTTITMSTSSASISCTATFSPIWNLNLTATGGSYTFSGSGGLINLDNSAAFDITAVNSQSNYRFTGWTGCSGTGLTASGKKCTIAARTEDLTIVANFVKSVPIYRFKFYGSSSYFWHHDLSEPATFCIAGGGNDPGGTWRGTCSNGVWQYEGIAFYLFPTAFDGSSEIKRQDNDNGDRLLSVGWEITEGSGGWHRTETMGYADNSGGTPVYRRWTNLGTVASPAWKHFFSADINEALGTQQAGSALEGNPAFRSN